MVEVLFFSLAVLAAGVQVEVSAVAVLAVSAAEAGRSAAVVPAEAGNLIFILEQ